MLSGTYVWGRVRGGEKIYMLKLYQFETWPYCEKVRKVLSYKQLDYEKIEVPRNDKSELIKISGQELVPVLVDNDKVIVDSTDIIEYLEKHY